MVKSVLMSVCVTMVAKAGFCPDDPEVDLCESTSTTKAKVDEESSGASRWAGGSFVAVALTMGLGGKDGSSHLLAPLMLSALLVPGQAAAAASSIHQTCGDMKEAYKGEKCCGAPTQTVHLQSVPFPPKAGNKISGLNICAGKKVKDANWPNIDCLKDGVVAALEQAGADVTKNLDSQGKQVQAGKRVTAIKPQTKPYHTTPMCPVNVHWHVGAEHRSAGQYDENGKGPKKAGTPAVAAVAGRRLNATERSLAGKERYGFACRHYDATKTMYTTPYKWQHCIGMHVGETYEVHWPHSALGACHTPHQYQTPFYDGVFCNYDPKGAHQGLQPQGIADNVGVQAQVFVIVNDESYYYPNLIKGMITQGDFGKDMAIYTGSTTGTSRNNKICSSYAPITWQVDRKCHLISASSFDKMCGDMKQINDDMSLDLHAHGARELVDEKIAANNLVNGHSR